MPVIRPCHAKDAEEILEIVNDAAYAFRGLVPAEHWHEPFMSPQALQEELRAGVRFFGFEEDGRLLGVVGSRDVAEVTVIEHTYVRTEAQRRGVGSELLAHMHRMVRRPTFAATFKSARWAVKFYESQGFTRTSAAETRTLLASYWAVPEWQAEKSVVLAEPFAILVILDAVRGGRKSRRRKGGAGNQPSA